jgi:hypothetical protein
LSENFGTHEKQIIADLDPVQLVEKLKNKYSDIWNTKLELFPDKPARMDIDALDDHVVALRVRVHA